MADGIEKIESGDADISRLKRLKSNFIDDYKAEEPWRANRREYGRFYDGDQLSDDEKRELERRGQPPVVVNRIKPKIDAICGIVQELGVETKAYPLGDRENEATEVSERFRSIENDSHFNEEELQVFKDVVIDGAGYFKTTQFWDGLEKRTITEHAPNHHICIDKFCRRADLKDAKRVHEHMWMDLEDAQGLFEDSKEALESATTGPGGWSKSLQQGNSQERPDQYQQSGGSRAASDMGDEWSDFVDTGRKRVRIITTYYRTTRVRTFITAGGVTQDVSEMGEAEKKKIQQSFENYQEWTQEDKQLNSVTFCWNAILDDKKNLRPFDREGKYPIVKAHAYVTREEEVKRPYGLVKQHLDPQKEINKRRSKMLHLLNTNQTWFEEGAFGQDESKARSESVRPDGWIQYRKEFKVDRITHQELAQSQFQLLQESKKEIDQAGVNEEIEGETRARSGREFQLRLKEGLKSVRELMTNIRAARRRVAEYWLDEILEDMKREAKARGDVFTMRKYDVVIEESAESVNLQSETFEQLAQLAKGGLPLSPQILIKASPLPPKVKSEILSDMQAEQQARAAAAQAAQANGQAPGHPVGHA